MLPLGYLRPAPGRRAGARYAPDATTSSRRMLTLWAMARSPLILGANLTRLDERTTRL